MIPDYNMDIWHKFVMGTTTQLLRQDNKREDIMNQNIYQMGLFPVRTDE